MDLSLTWRFLWGTLLKQIVDIITKWGMEWGMIWGRRWDNLSSWNCGSQTDKEVCIHFAMLLFVIKDMSALISQTTYPLHRVATQANSFQCIPPIPHSLFQDLFSGNVKNESIHQEGTVEISTHRCTSHQS